MPYQNNADLPPSIQDALPHSAQSLFRQVFNQAASRGLKEERAMQVSWGAVKQAGYEKGDQGKWIKKQSAELNLPGGSAFFTAEIKKFSTDDQRLVFGWASIIEDADGNLITDSQGDTITPDELEKAAYAFVHDVRKAGEMHQKSEGIGQLVESLVLTKAKREAMGLPPGPSSWWTGWRVAKDDVWQAIKDKRYTAFSIGGRGTRKEMN